ncbi:MULTISPECIES: SCO1664 family protein [unclassified Streptomyces]|uniref:SCO1664 family protein n=1 Tax=unclassified Streptomyces TaxID=2593676 RepID=UPI000A3E4081|nr:MULTISPECIES: SCO1664 family protein [unclassified Streptomyces]MCX5148626.1 SCO1664 family protein [Streptomyces sp. NBC_00320]WSN51698.1 SCO1664 family protein [Streptomyces sp. NBC_01296]WSW58879.1 SCO1664 family protein [Streptomyces sp. NBC_00998]
MPAPERLPAPGVTVTGELEELLAKGELTVVGRIREASNAVLLCTVTYGDASADCVYKPVKGERPLWDFPDGNLAQREVAAYLVSEAMGWGLVPPTVLRDGPYGEGMVQQWIESAPAEDGPQDAAESDESGLLALVEGEEAGEGWKPVALADVGEGRTALLVHADDPRLRRLAVLDAVINNGDRKGGHLLPAPDGRLYGIDHGVTFHREDKLRTLLWGWAGEPLTDEAREVLAALAARLAEGEPLATRLAELITPVELAAVRARVAHLLRTGVHPQPSGQWPAIPWPPV